MPHALSPLPLGFASVMLLMLCACGEESTENPGSTTPAQGDMGSVLDADMDESMTPEPARDFWEGELMDARWGKLERQDPAGPIFLLKRAESLVAASLYRELPIMTGAAMLTEATLSGAIDAPFCAAWVTAEQVSYGCAPDFEVLASTPTGGRGYHLTVSQDGAKLWYRQSSVPGLLVLNEMNAWEEVEVFESSISYYSDAIALEESGRGCLVNSTDQASISRVEGVSPIRVEECVLHHNGARLSMLGIGRDSASFGYAEDAEQPDASGVTRQQLTSIALPIEDALALADLGEEVAIFGLVDGTLHATVLRELSSSAGEITATLSRGAMEAWSELQGVRALEVFADGPQLLAIAQGSLAGKAGVHLLRASSQDLPTGTTSPDEPFLRIALPADVFSAAASPDGTIFTSAGRVAYRIAPGGEPEVLGNLGWSTATDIQAVSSSSAVFSTTGNASAIQSYSGGIWGESFPAAHQGALGSAEVYFRQDQQPQVCVSVISASELEPAQCVDSDGYPTISDLFFDSSGKRMLLLQTGDLVGEQEQLLATLPSALRANAGARHSHQAEDGSIWAYTTQNKDIFTLSGDTWINTGFSFELGFSEDIFQLHAISANEAYAARRNTIYRYDGMTWSEVDFGRELVKVYGLAGTQATGLLVLDDRKLYQEKKK